MGIYHDVLKEVDLTKILDQELTQEQISKDFQVWVKEMDVKPTGKVFITYLDLMGVITDNLHDEVKINAIEHYGRMIDFVEANRQFRETRSVYREALYQQIGETWDAANCAYCRKYSAASCNVNSCPLFFKEIYEGRFNLSIGCCNGLWEAMDNAGTWEDWLIAAKKVRSYIIEKG